MWNQPKENLQKLIQNPEGRLQELAHNRTEHLVGNIKDQAIEKGTEVGKSAGMTLAGDLFDRAAPGDDPVSLARHDGPDGWAQSRQTDQDLQG
jgi:hypothetical protein